MVSTGCASGTNAAGDDASGDDTACDQPCDAVEPTVGADMAAVATNSCDGTLNRGDWGGFGPAPQKTNLNNK
jgi:hypothetical protein